ncbi:MAG TPA: hypothetical protein VG826_23285 [Pirellulales bacterium]|nr:hypothetical protein [Pirellulales bacterium]
MTYRAARDVRCYVPGWPCWPAYGVAAILLLPLVSLFGGEETVSEPPVSAALPSTAFTVTGDRAFPWPAFVATVAVAAGAASLAVLVGGLVAVALELTDLPARSFWGTAMLVAFACPSAVWAMGQVYCYGPSGLADRWLGDAWRAWLANRDKGHYLSAVLVLGEIHAPLAMLLVGRGLVRLPQAGWEAARLSLPWILRWRWLLGAVRTELAAAWLLAFALSAGNFAVPHVLQCRLFPIELYLRLTNYLDRLGASLLALALLTVTLLAAAAVALFEGRVPTAGGEAVADQRESHRTALGRYRWVVVAALGLYLAITVVLPVGAMAVEVGSVSNFLSAVREAAPETANTLGTALAAASLALIAGAIVGRAAARKRILPLEHAALVPIAVPALVLGLAYSQFYNRAGMLGLRWLGDGNALIILGLTARAWPFAARAMMSGEQQIAPACHEAAWLAGLGRARRARWITAPLLANPALAGGLVAYLLTVGEVEISQLLCAPGRGTLALRLFTFLHFGPVHVAASLALLQLALAVLPVLAYFLFTNRCLAVV